MAIVYEVRNVINNMAYIGCTGGELRKRFNLHMSLLKRGKHTVPKMQDDYRVHGRQAFELVVLERLPEPATSIAKRAAELYWMQRRSVEDTLYNEYQVSFSGGKDHGLSDLWDDPRYRAQKTDQILTQLADPAFQFKRKEGMRNSDVYKAARKKCGAETAAKVWADPLHRQKMSERMRARNADPEFAKKRLEALREGKKRQRQRGLLKTYAEQQGNEPAEQSDKKPAG